MWAEELASSDVAVGCGLRDLGRADRAAGAGLVIDHDRLAHVLRHGLGHGAHDHVGGAAGRKGTITWIGLSG